LISQIKYWRKRSKKIVFTNGCFDLIHRGHVTYLNKAKSLGDKLVIGLNSDDSVSRLKGAGRPLMTAMDRAFILANLKAVNAVCLFYEDTPQQLIELVEPDVLVKGGDYKINEIVGREVVEKKGGKVVSVKFIEGFSTSELITKLQNMKTIK